MKKTLATLWLAWMLALSPKAQAGVSPKIEETKKDLIEAVIQGEDGKTVTIQESQKSQEQQLFEEIMENEKIQELINEYWQEEVEQVIQEIIKNEKTQEIIEESLKDKDIQKALEEWDQEGVEKWVQKIAKKYHWTFWGNVAKNTFIMIWGAVLWIIILRKSKY